jgi:hypothetical protein
MQFYGIDWLATVCGLSGVYLLGSKNRFGFALFMLASLSWLAVGLLINSLAMSLGSAAFFALHLRGFLNWSKETK